MFVVDHPAVKGQYFLQNCTFVRIKKTLTTFCLSVLLWILFFTGTITSTGSEQPSDSSLWRFIGKRYLQCSFCGIGFPDQTLYFLHKGCHSDANPWKCNICGEQCCNVYEFNSHLLSKSHQWQWMFNSKPKRGFGSIAIKQMLVFTQILFWISGFAHVFAQTVFVCFVLCCFMANFSKDYSLDDQKKLNWKAIIFLLNLLTKD